MQERSRKEKNILYIVVPCYNEEQVLAETSKRLKEKCEMLSLMPLSNQPAMHFDAHDFWIISLLKI